MFPDFANPFGADAFTPADAQTTVKTLYYKGLRLDKAPVAIKRGPKPLSHYVKNLLLTDK